MKKGKPLLIVLLALFLLAALALPVGADAQNLISDPSFEDQGDEIGEPWVLEEGEGEIESGGEDAKSGDKNVLLSNNIGWNAITQEVEVETDTDYILTAYIRTSDNNVDGYFGARLEGVLEEVNYEPAEDYEQLTVEFNSGDNETVEIFTGFHAGDEDRWIQVDDYSLVAADAVDEDGSDQDENGDENDEGEELPKTNMNTYNYIMIGSTLLLIGVFFFVINRRKSLKSE